MPFPEWRGISVSLGSLSLAEKRRKLISDGPLMRALSYLVLTAATLLYIVYDTLLLGSRVKGRRNLKKLKKGQGYISVANHTFPMEPGFISQAVFPRYAYFAIMEETFVNTLAEWGLRLLRGFPIPRRQGASAIGPEIKRVLDRGGAIHFFPEGHLTLFCQKPRRFKKGAFVAAIENQVPILPITTCIRRRFLFGKPLWRFWFRLTLVIDAPLPPPPCPETQGELLALAQEMANQTHEVISQRLRDELGHKD